MYQVNIQYFTFSFVLNYCLIPIFRLLGLAGHGTRNARAAGNKIIMAVQV